jgi:hypothetical protein
LTYRWSGENSGMSTVSSWCSLISLQQKQQSLQLACERRIQKKPCECQVKIRCQMFTVRMPDIELLFQISLMVYIYIRVYIYIYILIWSLVVVV